MQGKWLEWGSFSTVAISGKSGSGKTSTIRFIIAQLLLNGIKTIVCDPHGNAGTGSLKDSIEPISPFLAMPIAITLEDRVKAFRHIYRIVRDRIDGADATEKYAIILDEATQHFLECSKEQSAEFVRFLLAINNEGRKCNVACFLLGQNWRADFIGSRSVRSSITHTIFHRTDEAEIKLFIPSLPAKDKRMISQLPTGQIYVFPFMYRLKVPYVSQDDLIDFARTFKRATDLHDTLHADLDDSDAENDQSVQSVQAVQNARKIDKTLARAIKDIILARNMGKSKEQTIFEVLQIRKSGSSDKWKKASTFYDSVVRRYEQIKK